VSERPERKAWQLFREHHGDTLASFTRWWRRCKDVDPPLEALKDFYDRRAELVKPLGKKTKERVRHDDLASFDVTRVKDLALPPDDGAEFTLMPPDISTADATAEEAEEDLGIVAREPLTPDVTVTRRYEWDMGHRLPLHEGKCQRLHGHRYVAEVSVSGPVVTALISSTGMVVDFGDLDALLENTIGEWDHRTMLWDQDNAVMDAPGVFRVPYMPTAENICLEIRRRVSSYLIEPLHVSKVRVWETPKACAES
jgi:6-pyruvoyltetrahydropterin/6-carboxytetrahydropterin synthase